MEDTYQEIYISMLGINPLKYIDPTEHLFESLWNAASLVIGVGSFVYNIKKGKILVTAFDGGGIDADGAGRAIKTARDLNRTKYHPFTSFD